ncbi:MAG: L-histidine N(alpha)-methyltransferase [Bacteroidota bacterium]
MQKKPNLALGTAFAQDIYQGLTAYPKHLSSKYFYDETGDTLFQKIMNMPEYYLTNCEFDILERNKSEICSILAEDGTPFSLFELGAGDGKKTKILLQHLLEKEMNFDYRPIDISQNALNQLQASIKQELPQLNINTLQGTYFEALKDIKELHGRRKIILFLGSNIGNLLHPQAIDFLKNLRNALNDGDLLLMGMDQKKNPQTILNAYSDATGITEAFNKNVLVRINHELGGNFNIDQFLHWEVYDPETGTAKSYLVAKEAHEVLISGLDLTVTFKRWETIHTEISQKYDDDVVQWLADRSGLEITTQFTDTDERYKNYIFKKK